MAKVWMLTRNSRSRSWVSYRLLAAGPELQTHVDRSGVVGRHAALRGAWTLPAIVLATAVASVAGTIGPDARWLPALGRAILRASALPHGVPYASASSAGWHNVPVLAELTFRGLQASLGMRGLLAAQVAAVALACLLVARDAKRLGATDAGIAAVLVMVVTGGLLALAGIRAQLFALVLFPALVLLLRKEEETPSRRIWLVVPLLALWSNLHGSALVGAGLVLIYLVAERARRRSVESAAAGLASLLALCATPALWSTPAYYADALTNEAARRGYGLWAPLSVTSGFDLVLAAAALVLLAGFVRTRPRPWQFAAALVLAAFTVHAARNGIWLLLFVAAPAACALRTAKRPPAAVSHGLALVLAGCAIAGLVRGPLEVGASRQLIAQTLTVADGRPILADPAVAEQIAQAGGRVWIANPLDAFRHADQRLYLDWLQGRPAGDRVLAKRAAVVVSDGSPADRRLSRDRRFYKAGADGRYRLFIAHPRSS
jgi:hypothetical protein